MKKETIRFRCSRLERLLIEKKASNAGMSVSALCRASVLGQKIGNRLTAEELEAYEMLQKYRNNFQNIANLLKSKDSTFAKEVGAAVSHIKSHLKKFE